MSPTLTNRGITRATLAFCFCLIVNCSCRPQFTVISRDHTCDGEATWGVPACESAWRPHISAVFLGRAIDVREEDVPILLEGEKAQTKKLRVAFQVEEGYIGVQEKTVIVTSGGDLCGFPFDPGREYLVYGRRLPNGEIYVSISSGTSWRKDALEDLKYLRNLPNAPHGATIYGTAYRFTKPERLDSEVRQIEPEAGAQINIKGSTQSYKAWVDKQGNFKIDGLPADRYTVSLSANGEISTFPHVPSTTLYVPDKGCGRFNFNVDPFESPEPPNSPNKPPSGAQTRDAATKNLK
jgi:hypothetical protein